MPAFTTERRPNFSATALWPISGIRRRPLSFFSFSFFSLFLLRVFWPKPLPLSEQVRYTGPLGVGSRQKRHAGHRTALGAHRRLRPEQQRLDQMGDPHRHRARAGRAQNSRHREPQGLHRTAGCDGRQPAVHRDSRRSDRARDRQGHGRGAVEARPAGCPTGMPAVRW